MVNFEEKLLDCGKDRGLCLLSLFVPGGQCWVQARAVSIVNGGIFWTPFLLSCLGCCIGSAVNRQRVRDSFLIKGSVCMDCMLYVLCGPCAATQEYREITSRIGLNKSLILSQFNALLMR